MYSDNRDESPHIDCASHAKIGQQPFPDRLYVVTAIFNPKRFGSRYEHYRAFARHMKNSGVVLYTIEAALGDREFEVTERDNPNHIQIRTKSVIWHKETLTNLAIQRLPLEAKHIAWVDADLTFVNPRWAQDTLHALQEHRIVQMFSHIVQLGPKGEPLGAPGISFMQGWRQGIAFETNNGTAQDKTFYQSGGGSENGGRKIAWCGSPGGAWAARRECLDALGGLIDTTILGSADYHQALSLFGALQCDIDNVGYHPAYCANLIRWQTRALEHIRKDVGLVDGTILHHWHGKFASRGYEDRWKILVRNQFNPEEHLKRDATGLWQLEESATQLRDDVRSYFAQRNEDSIDR